MSENKRKGRVERCSTDGKEKWNYYNETEESLRALYKAQSDLTLLEKQIRPLYFESNLP